MDVNQKLSQHFTLREFLHNGNPAELSPFIIRNLTLLAEKLERVRTLCGDRPITINSGFRTKAHNKEVGGVALSLHTLGMAADIVVEGLSPGSVQKLLKDWDGGLGSYSTFTHVDWGRKRRWSGS